MYLCAAIKGYRDIAARKTVIFSIPLQTFQSSLKVPRSSFNLPYFIRFIKPLEIQPTTDLIILLSFAPKLTSLSLNGHDSSHQTKLFRFSSAFPSDKISNEKRDA